MSLYIVLRSLHIFNFREITCKQGKGAEGERKTERVRARVRIPQGREGEREGRRRQRERGRGGLTGSGAHARLKRGLNSPKTVLKFTQSRVRAHQP